MLVVLALAATALASPGKLTQPAVRAFLAKQEAAWNAEDARGWAALFTPDARFVDQALGSDNKVVVNGASTLAQATAQAQRFFAKSSFRETAEVKRIEIAPDGRSARVLAMETIRIEQPDRPARTLCTETQHDLVFAGGGVRSRGQTDTAVRCRAAR